MGGLLDVELAPIVGGRCPDQAETTGPANDGSGNDAASRAPQGSECQQCMHLCAGCGKPMMADSAKLPAFLPSDAGPLTAAALIISDSSNLADCFHPPR
jgi:hypothetical protein